MKIDADQEAIIKSLKAKVKSPANTDEFNGIQIEIEVNGNEDTTILVEIVVVLQQQFASQRGQENESEGDPLEVL